MERFKKLLFTDGDVFFLVSSGTGAMEASIVNMFREGDQVLVLSTGKFGERWRDMAERFNLRVTFHEEKPGYSLDVERVKKLIKDNQVAGVLTTLTDTSTGVTNDIKSIATFTREKDIPLIVDAVSGFLADPLKMDPWGVDVVIGGSQKSLACPPGIGFVALRKNAWRFIEKSNLPRYYWDLPTYKRFAEKGQTPYTPAIPVFMALRESLKHIESAESSWMRFKQIATEFRKGLEEMNIKTFPRKPSNALTIVDANGRADEVIDYILKKHGVLFANGQQEMKGKIVRISHMGHLNEEDMKFSLKLIKEAWEELKI